MCVPFIQKCRNATPPQRRRAGRGKARVAHSPYGSMTSFDVTSSPNGSPFDEAATSTHGQAWAGMGSHGQTADGSVSLGSHPCPLFRVARQNGAKWECGKSRAAF